MGCQISGRMKKAFFGYYKPSEDEFAELWNGARIVVDANVLLGVYGLSPSTREALLGILERVRDRLWIPNQFAFEYQRHRVDRIRQEIRHYEEAHKSLHTVLEQQFRSRTQHPFVSRAVEKGLERICKRLLEGKREEENLLRSDPYFARTTDLFAGKVGPPYSEAQLNQAYEVARERFKNNIPPGFKDAQKPESTRYGDYVGWRQILDFAAKSSVSVILVTDDAKEDWWRMEGSENYGPRPELIVEFRDVCSGLFYMYPSDGFLELSGRYIGGPVNPAAISELKERRQSEMPSEMTMKPTEAPIPEPLAIKSSVSAQERSVGDQEKALDLPKLTAEEVAKPEEK